MSSTVDVIEEADQLERAGRYAEAITLLTDENLRQRSPELEVRLAALRHRAWPEIAGAAPVGPWPPPDLEPIEGFEPPHLPDFAFADLTPDLLARAIYRHGALIVRGLFVREQTEILNADIDRAMAAVRAAIDGHPEDVQPEWFTPIETPGYDLGGPGRFWVLNSGTVWTADSPRTLFDLTHAIDDVGLGHLLTEYFGQRPALSVVKCAMKRVPPDLTGGWHQDGYVAGPETRALNVWVVTTDCGEVARGLDIYPARLDHMVDTAMEPPFDFCVSDDLVADMAADIPIARPNLAAGDAVLFDQFLLHQTGSGFDFTSTRYGFECWFFCPSTFPERFVPLVF